MGDYERFSEWYEDEGKFMIRMGETCEEAYEALRRHVEESITIRRRYPVHKTKPSALGMLGVLPTDIRLILYRRYGLAPNVAHLSKRYREETKELVPLSHHSHICGKDVTFMLKKVHTVIREIIKRHQPEEDEQMDTEGVLTEIGEALDAMSLPNHRSNERAVIVNLFFCPLGVRQTLYNLEITPTEGGLIVGATMPRQKRLVASSSDQVGGITFQLLMRRLGDLYEVPLVLSQKMMRCILGLRYGCIAREPDYVSRMSIRLIHSYLWPFLRLGDLSGEHLTLTRVVVRPPTVLPGTTRLMDVFLSRNQWTEEESDAIKGELDRMVREDITQQLLGDRNKQRLNALKPMLSTITGAPMELGDMLGSLLNLRMGCDNLRKEVYSKLPVLPRGAS